MSFTATTVKTRKEHRCKTCYRKFPKGTSMRTQTCANDGDIYTWRQCMTCTALIDTHPKMFACPDYGWIPEGAVSDVLNEDQTPEQLLEKLLSDKKHPTPAGYVAG